MLAVRAEDRRQVPLIHHGFTVHFIYKGPGILTAVVVGTDKFEFHGRLSFHKKSAFGRRAVYTAILMPICSVRIAYLLEFISKILILR